MPKGSGRKGKTDEHKVCFPGRPLRKLKGSVRFFQGTHNGRSTYNCEKKVYESENKSVATITKGNHLRALQRTQKERPK